MDKAEQQFQLQLLLIIFVADDKSVKSPLRHGGGSSLLENFMKQHVRFVGSGYSGHWEILTPAGQK